MVSAKPEKPFFFDEHIFGNQKESLKQAKKLGKMFKEQMIYDGVTMEDLEGADFEFDEADWNSVMQDGVIHGKMLWKVQVALWLGARIAFSFPCQEPETVAFEKGTNCSLAESPSSA